MPDTSSTRSPLASLRHVEFGSGWHRFVFDVGHRRWPTIRGENPPEGIPYLNIYASYGGRCVEIRLWDWRRSRGGDAI